MMSVMSSRQYGRADQATWVPKKYDKRDTVSPERTKVWVEPKPNNISKHRTSVTGKKVAVVYYLSHNGHLEHPHFVEVTLSSPEGLYLRDVVSRLNHIRGPGMANMYAWSSKRTYKTGYVWQDLSENDFIYPCHGHEYILKGSKLLESSLSFRSFDTVSSETNSSGELDHVHRYSDILSRSSNKNRSTLDDLDVLSSKTYIIARTAVDSGSKAAVPNNDASTQTQEKASRRGKPARPCPEEVEEGGGGVEELSKEEISPPPCSDDSSRELAMECSETTGNSRDHDYVPADIRNQVTETERPSGRIRASAVLMQLIMCAGSKNGDDIVSPHSRE